MGSRVRVRPAVKAAVLNMSKIVRDKVVAELIAFLYRGPERIGAGIPVKADRITRAGRKYLMTAAVRIVAVDGGATGIFTDIDVFGRAHADIELLPIAIKEQAASLMSFGEALQRDHFFAFSCHELVAIIRIPLHGLGFGNV